ncbi:hypothetical protein [Novosphingobium sp. KN65.2]|uniref:hypothetical protein n=1 Tax=Novosphingobium sp. KN65.2 TaxID=1478134 RepID=UPI0005E0AD55|nr:hypothetical protein [Novosphingobium sp. KN65.2]CDO37149.1 conserved hypothetical protein [Novosphingobium sp. KN65.2]
MQRMKADGAIPELPHNPLPYLTEWLFEIGPTSPGGMSAAAIGWRDMEAWQGLSGVDLEPWEARTLRRLSSDFVAMLHDAKAIDCPPPYATNESNNREAVSRKVGNAFRSMVIAQSKSSRRIKR